MGEETVLVGNGTLRSHLVGEGLPGGRTWRAGWLAQRTLGPIAAIGGNKIQYAKGHKSLTLLYQIDAWMIRLLRIGKGRTTESFGQFFDMIGKELAAKTEFARSDMRQPYLRVIRERCGNALNILDRFHIVAKLNEALDDVRAA